MKKTFLSTFILLFALCFNTNAQCLSGVYTIGGVSPNYATFSIAVGELITNGVCGSVVFNVRQGNYIEQFTLPQITGTSALNTITFKSENGDSSSVILSFPSSSNSTNNFVVNFNGADFINIEKISIVRTGTLSNATVISIGNNSDTLLFRKNIIKNNSLYGNSTSLSLVFSDSGASNDSISFVKNIFENGSSAIYRANTYSEGMVVDSNIFTNQYSYTIYLSYEHDLIMRNNSLTKNDITSSSSTGVFLDNCNDEITILSNKIVGFGYCGIQLNYCYGNFNKKKFLIATNFISGDGNGININNSSKTNIIANSVYTSGGTPFVLTNDAEVINNIFYSAGTYSAIYCSPSSYSYLSFASANTFHSNGYSTFNKGGISYFTISDWNKATGQDANSTILSRSPFASTTDLHVICDDFLYKRGVWTGINSNDIDGEARGLLSPCIGADEFQLPTSDARVLSIDSIVYPRCSGSYPINVSIYNGGRTVLTSATINWSVNNILQPPFNWTGYLLPPQSVDSNINIGNYNFASNSVYMIKIWTSNLNTGIDLFPVNDTLKYIYRVDGMSGTYTIGGLSPDFTNFEDAVIDLNRRSLCGPVIFNFRPGNYSLSLALTHITNASDINTITFTSENKDSSGVNIIDYGTKTAITIKGGDHFIFDHLTFKTTYADNCLWLMGKASNNKFVNCVFAPYYYAYGSPITFAEFECNYNSFINNRISGSNHKSVVNLFIQSATTTLRTRGFVFKNNVFEHVDSTMTALYANNLKNAVIIGNIIKGWAVNIEAADSSQFSSNYVYCPLGFSGLNCKIFNNFIWGNVGVSGDSSSCFVHNTVSGYGYTNTFSPVLSLFSSTTGPIIKNNILYNKGPGPIYANQSSYMLISNSNCNWNNLYSPIGPIAEYYGNHNLTSWQTVSGSDLNSVNNKPFFNSLTDLHISNPGTTIGIIPAFPFCNKDIDGDIRNMTKPNIGADEYATLTNAFDGGMKAILMGSQICYGSKPVKIKVFNNENSISLTQATIKWKVNNITQPDFIWSGVIHPHDTSSIFPIGNYFFNGGNNTIKVWITLSNGFPDPNSSNDTLTFSSFTNYPVNLGNDTTICEGNVISINAGIFFSYNWSTGAVSQTITATKSDQYSVTTKDFNGCISTDSIKITIPISNLGKDTSLCVGTSMNLDAGQNFVSYLWSNGATTQTILANGGNTYWVKSYGVNSCSSRDTITIGSNQLPNINLGKDTTICSNASITLSAGIGFANYLWSDGSSSITNSFQGGLYGIPDNIWVKVIDNFGCIGSDSINVYAKTINATVTCNGSGATINAGTGYLSYNWFGTMSGFNSNKQTISVTSPDQYILIAYDLNGCEATSKYDLRTFFVPAANYTYSTNGLVVDFTYLTNNLTYSWDFGDGTTSSLQNPLHSYSKPGNYIVTLKVSNGCGSNSTNQNILINNVSINKNDGENEIRIYPNPYFDNTTIEFVLNKKLDLSIEIYNTIGQKVETLVNMTLMPGEYKYNFTSKENDNDIGIYFVKIILEGKVVVKKIVSLN
ncbi:MAG: PKD domain-containing protein [Bacteroidia bacterium]|nr:PKD domain-containing protein [Bacteroidia bacterium]